jgi:RPA family protein
MAATATQYHAASGVNLRWGLGSSAITVTGATGTFQSIDYDENVEKNEIRDQRGTVAAVIFYNPTATATIEYVVSDGSAVNGTATISKPDQGTNVTVTSAAGDSVAATNWLVESTTQKEMNTDAVKVTLKLIRYLNVLT